jgi:hypothetical protein
VTPEQVWDLLPSALRARDEQAGGALRAVVAELAAVAEELDADLGALWDDWFIETCEEWLVPYLGDLVGVPALHPLPGAAFSHRARVADVLRHRRRKGTAAMLEDLARTTTGWSARAVEFFEVLSTTQHLDNVRLQAPATAPVRSGDAMERVGTPFDDSPRTVDVRALGPAGGWYSLPHVGLFVWPLAGYPLDRATAAPAPGQPAGCWSADPLAVDHAMHGPTVTEPDVDHRATESSVPSALRRRPLRDELAAVRDGTLEDGARRWFRPEDPAVVVWVQPSPGAPLARVELADLFVCDLADWSQPTGSVVRLDPVRGRVAVDPARSVHRLAVSWSYALAGDLGAGPASRRGSGGPAEQPVDWQLGVSATDPPRPDEVVATLAEAVDAWHAWQGAHPASRGRIVVMDSHRYVEPFTGPDAVRVGQGSRLSIVAARWPAPPSGPRVVGALDPTGVRPCVSGDLVVRGEGAGDAPGQLSLEGLLLDGSLTAEPPAAGDDGVGLVELVSCTLVPGRGGLRVEDGNDAAEVVVRRSVCGPVRLPPGAGPVTVAESVLHGPAGGAALDASGADASLRAVTAIGTASVRSLAADDCLLTGRVEVARRQRGCVRFSYVLPGSTTPRRYRCQPDTAVAAAGGDASAAARVAPAFVSLDLADATYALLAGHAAAELREGAADGSSMGAYAFVLAPQRLANLASALPEHLPFGRTAAALPVLPVSGGLP